MNFQKWYLIFSTIIFSLTMINTYNPEISNDIDHYINIYSIKKLSPKLSDSSLYKNYFNNLKNKKYAPINELNKLGVISSWKIYSPKRKIKLAIIDTPIHYNNDNIRQISSESLKNFNTENPHGEHVLNIIKTINPNIEIISIPFYQNQKDNIKASNNALKVAIKENVDIINYSAGGTEYNQEEFNLLQKAKEKGIIVVVASGNEKCLKSSINNCNFFPAGHTNNLTNLIAVSSVNSANHLSKNSNAGTALSDISAYGDKIKSLYKNKYKIMSGTSQATAFVSGIISLAISHNTKINASNIKDFLCSSSTKLSHLKTVNKCSGIINSRNLISY